MEVTKFVKFQSARDADFKVGILQLSPIPQNILATSWENLLMLYVNNKGADQTAHLRNLIISFVIHCLDSILPLLAKAEISRPQLVLVAEQASLSLIWLQTPKTGFLVTWLI